MSGITIIDVKVVGLCRKHDIGKLYIDNKEEDIYCIECAIPPKED